MLFTACQDKKKNTSIAKVYVQNSNGKYTLYKNRKPFYIKGGAGYTNLKDLKSIGGNTIRTWDTTNLGKILDSAQKYNLAVVAGLWMPNSNQTEVFYKDSLKVSAQLRAFKLLINKYKSHPAVLMWCVGNELDFPYKPSYTKFYAAFNSITDMIHRDDPDHPVTTTVLNFNKKHILNLKVRCNVDLISFNMFGKLTYLKDELKSFAWFWKGPFLITEWGLDGPWEGTTETAWGAYTELTSTQKAKVIRDRYQHAMPLDNAGFLGSMIFYWGSKQEGTHTWYSLFDKNGAKSETVNTLQYLWTNKQATVQPPRIKQMLLNKKVAAGNILLTVNQTAIAEIEMLTPLAGISKIEWEIYPEDWYKKNEQSNNKYLKPLPGLIKHTSGLKAEFTAPLTEGPYRIFYTVYNQYGYFATCNIPFYVLSKK